MALLCRSYLSLTLTTLDLGTHLYLGASVQEHLYRGFNRNLCLASRTLDGNLGVHLLCGFFGGCANKIIPFSAFGQAEDPEHRLWPIAFGAPMRFDALMQDAQSRIIMLVA